MAGKAQHKACPKRSEAHDLGLSAKTSKAEAGGCGLKMSIGGGGRGVGI